MRVAGVLAFAVSTLFAQKQPFDVNALMAISRIGEPMLSPNGKTIAFTVQIVDLDSNTKPQQIYTVPLDGGVPMQITQDGTANERPRWSPDSRTIFYTSNRGGSKQVWAMEADGPHSRQITHLSTETSGQIVSPDGKKLVFLSEVYPECGSDDACNKRTLDDETKSKLLLSRWTERKIIRSLPIRPKSLFR
jgi:Tol biopolymer transport system component